MRILDRRPELVSFWSDLREADQRILLLDYDGVIAPFHPDPMQARPFPAVPPILSSIQARPRSRLVIVTGRPALEAVGLLDLPSAPEVWGNHGYQHLAATGELSEPDLPATVRAALVSTQQLARESAFGGAVEIKPFGVALHWRGVPPAELDGVRASADELIRSAQAAGDGLFVRHDFDGGIELLVAGRDKGVAVTEILAGARGYRAAYLGDDVTDEDAFRAAPRDVLTVLVRAHLRVTAASAWLAPPGELVDFLRRWDAACA